MVNKPSSKKKRTRGHPGTKKKPIAHAIAPNEGPHRNPTPIKGVSLVEFKADDLGAMLVDGSAGGATPVPVKNAPPKRMSKAQRQALGNEGKTPPLHITLNPMRRKRKAAENDKDRPVARAKCMMQKKRKETTAITRILRMY